MKYGMWLDEWFRNYIQPSSKIKTCERYSEIIEKHLKVKLGEYELDELTPLVLQRYVTGLMQSGNIVTGKGLAANSVNGIITVIQNSAETRLHARRTQRIHGRQNQRLDLGAGTQTPQTAMSLADEVNILRQQVKNLTKENRRLKEENEFLEEASAFFAASRRKSAKAAE